MGWNTDVACSEGGDGESEKRVKMNASLWYLLKIRIRHEIKQYFGKTNVSTHTQKISRRWLETKNSLHVSWESLCWLRAHISICGCMGRKTEGKKKNKCDAWQYIELQKLHRWDWKYREYPFEKHCFWDDHIAIHQKVLLLFDGFPCLLQYRWNQMDCFG